MKIIDLLNKISNGEELPQKIYWFDREFYLKNNTYYGDIFTFMHYIQEKNLNDEIKIIEEEPRDINVCGRWFTKSEYDKLSSCEEEKKIPEKLEICKITDETISGLRKSINVLNEDIASKINEIIDYLKSKGE